MKKNQKFGVGLIPLCLGAMGKNNGTEFAPELLSKELGLDGKIFPVKNLGLDGTDAEIEKNAIACMEKNRNCLFIGGDHSITYSTVKAFSRRYGGKNAALVMFDSHADCTFFTKTKSHEDFVRALVEENFLLPKNILIVGARNIWKEEKEFLQQKKISYITTVEFLKNPASAKKTVRNFVRGKKAVYLTIDFDVLDARIAFATGYPEPKGLSERQLLALLKAALQPCVRAVDFVEYNPLFDRRGKCLALSKRIVEFVLRNQ